MRNSQPLWILVAENPVDNPCKRSYLWQESAEELVSVSSASKRSKNSPCESSASLGVVASPSSLLFHHSRVSSTSTSPKSIRLYGGVIPRSAAIHDADKRLAKIAQESLL